MALRVKLGLRLRCFLRWFHKPRARNSSPRHCGSHTSLESGMRSKTGSSRQFASRFDGAVVQDISFANAVCLPVLSCFSWFCCAGQFDFRGRWCCVVLETSWRCNLKQMFPQPRASHGPPCQSVCSHLDGISDVSASFFFGWAQASYPSIVLPSRLSSPCCPPPLQPLSEGRDLGKVAWQSLGLLLCSSVDLCPSLASLLLFPFTVCFCNVFRSGGALVLKLGITQCAPHAVDSPCNGRARCCQTSRTDLRYSWPVRFFSTLSLSLCTLAFPLLCLADSVLRAFNRRFHQSRKSATWV